MEPTHTHFILQPGKTHCQTSVTTSDSGMWADFTGERLARQILIKSRQFGMTEYQQRILAAMASPDFRLRVFKGRPR